VKVSVVQLPLHIGFAPVTATVAVGSTFGVMVREPLMVWLQPVAGLLILNKEIVVVTVGHTVIVAVPVIPIGGLFNVPAIPVCV
jgi:hypothetical protein